MVYNLQILGSAVMPVSLRELNLFQFLKSAGCLALTQIWQSLFKKIKILNGFKFEALSWLTRGCRALLFNLGVLYISCEQIKVQYFIFHSGFISKQFTTFLINFIVSLFQRFLNE